MNIKLEYLKHSDLKAYKTLLDDVLGEGSPLVDYQAHYKEDHPSVKVVVAKKDDEIVGTLTFVLMDTFTSPLDPKIEFSNFAIIPSARGGDAATLLMRFVADFAKEHGYKSIVVNCLAKASRAHQFYKKMGFEHLDTTRFQLKVK